MLLKKSNIVKIQNEKNKKTKKHQTCKDSNRKPVLLQRRKYCRGLGDKKELGTSG